MTIEQIEKAILNLSQDDFTKLKDQQLEQDIINGKLDKLASEALADFEAGNYQQI